MPPKSSNVTLHPATESNLPLLIPLQFLCFRHVKIEQFANPDTPASHAAMLTKHQTHMREDKGLRIVKAVLDSGSGEEEEDDDERVVGFCMFYFPIRDGNGNGSGSGSGREAILPIPLRKGAEGTTYASPSPSPSPGVGMGTQTQTEGGEGIDVATASSMNQAPATATATPTSNPIHLDIAALQSHRLTLLSRLIDPVRGAGFVRYMCVDPSYRCLGIGRRLMAWGIERFDAQDVDVYLEATVEGEGLYREFGFERVGWQEFVVDGIVRERYACMWRSAGGKERDGEQG